MGSHFCHFVQVEAVTIFKVVKLYFALVFGVAQDQGIFSWLVFCHNNTAGRYLSMFCFLDAILCIAAPLQQIPLVNIEVKAYSTQIIP